MRAEEIRDTFRYHSPSPEAVELHESIRDKTICYVEWVAGNIPNSRERSTFITLMQQAQMMANAAVAIHGLPDAEQRRSHDEEVRRLVDEWDQLHKRPGYEEEQP